MYVGSEILTAVVMKNSIFWDITPRSLLKSTDVSEEHVASILSSACYLLRAGFLRGLFFDPEDGGDMFLRNVGSISMDYKASYPRRQNSSRFIYFPRKFICLMTND
jgi:hypothetical protein